MYDVWYGCLVFLPSELAMIINSHQLILMRRLTICLYLPIVQVFCLFVVL